jgi:dienelactone hydrolase
VILSHGSGGSDLVHWDTAIALAEAGFIAAAALHPRNNFHEGIHDDQRIVLDGRPRQLSAIIDALLAQQAWSSRINFKKIAAFGFSAGGYTVLAALGTLEPSTTASGTPRKTLTAASSTARGARRGPGPMPNQRNKFMTVGFVRPSSPIPSPGPSPMRV